MNIQITIIEEPLEAEQISLEYGLGPKKTATLIRKCPGHWFDQNNKARVMRSDWIEFFKLHNREQTGDHKRPIVRRKTYKSMAQKAREMD